jgi:hypothetical protein
MSLYRKQGALEFKTRGKASEGAVGRHHPVAGNNDRHRV